MHQKSHSLWNLYVTIWEYDQKFDALVGIVWMYLWEVKRKLKIICCKKECHRATACGFIIVRNLIIKFQDLKIQVMVAGIVVLMIMDDGMHDILEDIFPRIDENEIGNGVGFSYNPSEE